MSLKSNIWSKINGVFRRTYWFNEVAFPDCRKFWQHNEFNLDFVNLGSTSSLYAFKYDGLPIKAANWALRAHNLRGDLLVLKNYFSYIKEGGRVALPLCPFSAISGEWEEFEDRYYSILKLRSIPHFSYRKKIEVEDRKLNPLRYFPLIEAIKGPLRFIKGNKSHKRSEVEMEKSAQQRMKSWMAEFTIYDMDYELDLVNRDALQRSIAVLRQIIDFCLERNLKPIIIIPPVYHTLSEKFSAKAQTYLTEALINGTLRPEVPYLNYWEDTEFTNDITLFNDSFLLNDKGAKKFTQKVLKDIQLIK